jgi:putative selenium metabolism protein SsnA
MEVNMLIKNGVIWTGGEAPEIIENGAIHISNGLIDAVGKSSEVEQRFSGDEVIDAGERLVMPGLICAHTHFYGAFARGMAIPGEPPKTFVQILERLWWKLDRALDEESVRISAQVSIADAIRHGTTTLFDHHASPNFIDGSLDVIAEVVEQSGVRASLSYEVTDRNGKEGADAGIRENVRFLKRLKENPSDRLAGLIGLHASLTLSDETLKKVVAEAEGLGAGFHIHVAEGQEDVDDSLKKSGLRVVHRLWNLGILGHHTIAAHAVYIDPWEMEVLRHTRTWVSHQPRSNMNNAVGVADVPSMLRGGMAVVLGNDGFSNDMFMEMKFAYLLPKEWWGDPRLMGADEVLKMAVANNGRLATEAFGVPLGKIAPGAAGDVIILDYFPYTPMTAGNFPWHVIFGVSGSHVNTTIVGGKVLMKDRQILTLDEERIAARGREIAPKVWERVARM